MLVNADLRRCIAVFQIFLVFECLVLAVCVIILQLFLFLF